MQPKNPTQNQVSNTHAEAIAKTKGTIAITLGDPAGIGPEVVVKTLLAQPTLERPWLLIGNLWSLQMAADMLQVKLPVIHMVNDLA